jgi:beta-lactam-binding protein with PASTA domain
MKSRGVIFLGGALMAGVLLGTSAPPSRALPVCSEMPAAQRESERIAGRCQGQAPIVNLSQGNEARTPRAPVPDLRGQVFDQQDERLARFFVAVDYRPSAQQRDVVLDQTPRPPATLRPGGDLRVVLSDGALVSVPDVRGGFARALMLLHRAGLAWSAGESSADRVIGQSPAPGTVVRQGTEIVLRMAAVATSANPTRATNSGPPATPRAGAAIAATRAAAAPTASTAAIASAVSVASTASTSPGASLRATGPLALAPESTRPVITPAPAPSAAPSPAPATPPASGPPPSGGPTPAPSSPPASTPAPSGATSQPPAATSPAPRTAATMPDVEGMAFDAARDRLAGLNVQRTHRAGTEPGGTVIGQTPAAGAALAPGTTVRIIVSDGSLVRVPRVMSFTINEARQRLINGELRAVVTTVASDAPAGTVVSQSPGEGDIARRGGTVRVGVSAGPATPPTVAMPNLVGTPLDRARPQLGRFKVERTERGSREPAGVILEQSPAPGESVQAGGTVSITVSSGGPPEAIDLQDVVGQDVDGATAALSEFRLEREAVPSIEPAGRVLAQDPAPGAGVAPGSTVRLRVSDGTLVRAPSLTNTRLDEARQDAAAKDLRITIAGGPDDADAVVVRQQPAAGSEVARGTVIQLVVEDRSPLAAMQSGARDAWQRGTAAFGQVPNQLLAVALGLLLLLIALVVLARGRRRTVKKPWYEVAPGPAAGPAAGPAPGPSPVPARAQGAAQQRASSVSTPVLVATKAGAMKDAATRDAPTKAASTTAAAAPTTPVPTTAAQKTAAPTKAVLTSGPPTKAVPTGAPTDAAPTGAAPTNAAPAGAALTDAAPTMAAPTKAAPTKAAPTKAASVERAAAWRGRPAQPAVAAPVPAPEPVVFGASVRVEADGESPSAPAAAPRGPEIRISARLEPGANSVRERADEATSDELTEETK